MRDLQWLQRKIVATCSLAPDHVGADNFHGCLLGVIIRGEFGSAANSWADVASVLGCTTALRDPVLSLAARTAGLNDTGTRWGDIPWALRLLPGPIPSRASARMPKKLAKAIVAMRTEPVVEWPAVTPADPIPSWIDDTLAAVKVPAVAGLSVPAEGELIEV